MSLPVCAGWSKLLLFSLGSSFIALQLQICLLSSPPLQEGGEIQFGILSSIP
jgi:hypothetical protein